LAYLKNALSHLSQQERHQEARSRLTSL
jgi:hypothetical protein